MRIKLLVVLTFVFAAGSVFSFAEQAGGRSAVLYIFAHQDDEIGIVAKMRQDVRSGRETHAMWLTDGAASSDGEVREQESRDAMKFIGLDDGNLHFLRYPDNFSFKYVPEIYRDVLRITGEIKPAEITSIAYEGGNIDHDVTSLMAALVIKRIDPRIVHYEFPLYSNYNSAYRMGKFIPYEGVETLYVKLDRELYGIKKDVFQWYPSQMQILNMLKAMMNKKSLKKGEQYRVAPDYDYRRPPVEGVLGYETGTRHPHNFGEWSSFVVPFIDDFDAGKY
ncbi:MAG TPA: PIG-L family deacetylase [bacterium]|nr:PIG-L family deacetylase [bacterium]